MTSSFTDDNEKPIPITGSFHYTAAALNDLGAAEYTVVCIAVDCSGSTSPFQAEMEKALDSIVAACQHSPRHNNLLLRVITFDQDLVEVHGYKPLASCPKTYTGKLFSGGYTALFDAALNAVESVAAQAAELHARDFEANGLVFVITDGEDNASKITGVKVGQAMAQARTEEKLESILSLLIGVNVSNGVVQRELEDFAAQGGFAPIPVKDPNTGEPVLDSAGKPKTLPFLALADALPSTIARLADFVSKSISSQAQAQGTGGPSQSISV